MTEDLATFRNRARQFVRSNLGPATSDTATRGLRIRRSEEAELAAVRRDQELQRMFFDAGLAGICFPKDYGGQGLTPDHQAVLNQELAGFEYPSRLQAPSISQCGAVILDFGTEEQKREHLPPVLRGDVIWAQFLSEPGGGSDVAGAVTTAVRDGDEWVLNGSKIWTSGAWWSHLGLCLVRTDWNVPKHRGLTVFMVPIDLPGIDVRRIELLSGSREFCEEFFTDVRLPDRYRIGDANNGWTVGVRWMLHERLGPTSPYYTAPAAAGTAGTGGARSVANAAGPRDDAVVRDLVGEAEMLELVGLELSKRVAEGMTTGTMTEQAAAISRLFHGVAAARTRTIAFELAAEAGVAWDDDDVTAEVGIAYLLRQVSTIAGGTSEMARNVISERVLGMPREQTLDREVAFRDVPRSGRANREPRA